ncbi:hypothetical protein PVK06_038064 [Gossypium arboreum]|uniref:Uncharacterized protein n=1 Tax=Gossypium arboreum TaxID=29729 RepID=A0ABR0N0Z1_GOSAR|nr:hypothetical protein PVK06_038064 [Gossypium arboreum]
MIRRPSGRIQGVLNFDMAVFDGADVPAFNGVSAISFRDLIGGKYIALFTNNKKCKKATVDLLAANLRKLTATALVCFACLSLTNLRILRQPFGFPVFRIFLDLTACLMLNIDDSFLSISSFA